MQRLINIRRRFREKIHYFPSKNLSLLCYPGIRYCYNTLSSIFLCVIYQVDEVVTQGKLKTRKNLKRLALRVAAVAYERWSLTKGSKQTWKILVFWKNGGSTEHIHRKLYRCPLCIRDTLLAIMFAAIM